MPVDPVTIGVIVAALATSVGVVAAVEQLALPARLKKLEAWARTSAEAETNEARRATLKQLEQIATARLIAGVYVPSHLFIPSAAWLVLGVAVVLSTFSGGEANWRTLPLILVAAAVLLFFHSRRVVHVYLERQRVAQDYFNGIEPVAPARLTLLHQAENGRPVLAFFAALGILAAAVGFASLTTSWDPLVPLLLATTGVMAVTNCLDALRMEAVSVKVLRATDGDRQPGAK